MDALEYEKARIRMCRTMILKEGGCEACPLYDGLRHRCWLAASAITNPDIDTIETHIDRVIKWAKDHPVKTRQSEFLKMFPNANIKTIIASLSPCVLDREEKPQRCAKYGNLSISCRCIKCRDDYWNEEVSE